MHPALALLKCKGNSPKEGDSLSISAAGVLSGHLSAFPSTVALGAMAGLRLQGLASSKLYQRRQDRLSGTGSLLSSRTDTAAGRPGYVSEVKGMVLTKHFQDLIRVHFRWWVVPFFISGNCMHTARGDEVCFYFQEAYEGKDFPDKEAFGF